MTIRLVLIAVIAVYGLSFPSQSDAGFSIIQHFPSSFITRSTVVGDSRVYGVTDSGAPFNEPQFFSFNRDGTDFRTRALNIPTTRFPYPSGVPGGPLGISGSIVVGATAEFGEIFTADDANTRVVSSVFRAPNLVERNPLVIDSTIYGAYFPFIDTPGFYKMNIDGSGFELLHATDDMPVETFLATDGVSLYGGSRTRDPIAYGAARLYRANIDGSGGAVLHQFDTDVIGVGAVAVSDDTVFGTTSRPGAAPQLFSIGTDGTGFTVLSEGQPNAPVPSRIVVDGDTLYGIAGNTIVRANLDGTDYVPIHRFGEIEGRDVENGHRPNDDLVLIGPTLYGSTRSGGRNGGGIFYSIAADAQPVPEPMSLAIWIVLGIVYVAHRLNGKSVLTSHVLYLRSSPPASGRG